MAVGSLLPAGEQEDAGKTMLKRLDTEYIDLLYVHQPVGDFVGAWRDMERTVEAGKVRALEHMRYLSTVFILFTGVDATDMPTREACALHKSHDLSCLSDISQQTGLYV